MRSKEIFLNLPINPLSRIAATQIVGRMRKPKQHHSDAGDLSVHHTKCGEHVKRTFNITTNRRTELQAVI